MRQNDNERAGAYFAESLRLSRWSGAAWAVARTIEGVSAVAVAQGRAMDAVRCLGAVAVFRETTGTLVARSERARHDHTVQTALDAIGELAFATAWEEGRAMSLEQAIAYALEENAS